MTVSHPRGYWRVGEAVDTIYGSGSIVGIRADGVFKVALESWKLAQDATVNCFVQASALIKPVFAVGDLVATTYGAGHIVDLRADKSVVVCLESWKLAGGSRPMLYLKDTSMVSPLAPTVTIPAAVVPAAPRTAEATSGLEGFWRVGEKVDTIYGSGVIVDIRATGVVKVALDSWKLAHGATVYCFLQQSALTKQPFAVGDDVATTYGEGRLLEMRADKSVVVQLHSWKLAGESRPVLYLKDETMISPILSAVLPPKISANTGLSVSPCSVGSGGQWVVV